MSVKYALDFKDLGKNKKYLINNFLNFGYSGLLEYIIFTWVFLPILLENLKLHMWLALYMYRIVMI